MNNLTYASSQAHDERIVAPQISVWNVLRTAELLHINRCPLGAKYHLAPICVSNRKGIDPGKAGKP